MLLLVYGGRFNFGGVVISLVYWGYSQLWWCSDIANVWGTANCGVVVILLVYGGRTNGCGDVGV